MEKAQWVSGGVHHHYGYITDNVGTINNLVDTTGGLASTGYDTWSYGENRSTITSYDTISTNNNQRYAGGTKVAELVKFGTRWYDVTTGRFTQQDGLSILGDPASGNRYAYAAGNPVTNIDPSGRCSVGEVIGSTLGIEGAGTLLEGTAVGAEGLAALEVSAATIGAGIALAGVSAASVALVGYFAYRLVKCN